MLNKILIHLLLFCVVNICYGECEAQGKNYSNLIPNIEIDIDNYNVVLTVENASDDYIIIDDPFGFSKEEVKKYLGSGIISTNKLGRIYPLGFYICVKDTLTGEIKKYSRVSSNMSVMTKIDPFVTMPYTKYKLNFNLKDLRYNDTGINLKNKDLKNKLIKGYFGVSIPHKNGYKVLVVSKETDWILLN